MSRLEQDDKAQKMHEENISSRSEKKKKEMLPPDASVKKEGVTSTDSAATGTPGKYSGEDTGEARADTGDDADKASS